MGNTISVLQDARVASASNNTPYGFPRAVAAPSKSDRAKSLHRYFDAEPVARPRSGQLPFMKIRCCSRQTWCTIPGPISPQRPSSCRPRAETDRAIRPAAVGRWSSRCRARNRSGGEAAWRAPVARLGKPREIGHALPLVDGPPCPGTPTVSGHPFSRSPATAATRPPMLATAAKPRYRPYGC